MSELREPTPGSPDWVTPSRSRLVPKPEGPTESALANTFGKTPHPNPWVRPNEVEKFFAVYHPHKIYHTSPYFENKFVRSYNFYMDETFGYRLKTGFRQGAALGIYYAFYDRYFISKPGLPNERLARMAFLATPVILASMALQCNKEFSNRVLMNYGYGDEHILSYATAGIAPGLVIYAFTREVRSAKYVAGFAPLFMMGYKVLTEMGMLTQPFIWHEGKFTKTHVAGKPRDDEVSWWTERDPGAKWRKWVDEEGNPLQKE